MSPKIIQGVADINMLIFGFTVCGFLNEISPWFEQLALYTTGFLFIALQELIFKSVIPQYMAPSVAINYVDQYVQDDAIEKYLPTIFKLLGI